MLCCKRTEEEEQAASREMNFQERLAWLRRMPTRWRVLFGAQAFVMFVAINVRLNDIERARQSQLKKEAEATVESVASRK